MSPNNRAWQTSVSARQLVVLAVLLLIAFLATVVVTASSVHGSDQKAIDQLGWKVECYSLKQSLVGIADDFAAEARDSKNGAAMSSGSSSIATPYPSWMSRSLGGSRAVGITTDSIVLRSYLATVHDMQQSCPNSPLGPGVEAWVSVKLTDVSPETVERLRADAEMYQRISP